MDETKWFKQDWWVETPKEIMVDGVVYKQEYKELNPINTMWLLLVILAIFGGLIRFGVFVCLLFIFFRLLPHIIKQHYKAIE